MSEIRQPIVTIVGHVDHGKTSLLDKIRGTAIAKTEPGLITQKISSTLISMETVKKICGSLLETLKIKITIPGLLFIDTPGHAAFQNLRKRGGNLADIAILVIDVNEGIKQQTLECIEILKQYKTPFIIALNKIDLISGWHNKPDLNLIQNIKTQSEYVRNILDKKLYDLVSRLYELKFNAERFDRVEDYTKQIAIVPVSAKTAEGLQELLMIITGLAQKYLEQSLKIEVKGPAKGTILEVKEEKGLGLTLDVIIYDGTIKVNDKIIIAGLERPIITKVKALFEPGKKGFKSVKGIVAAAGVKISAQEIENAVAGMPLRVIRDIEKDKKEIQQEVEEVLLAIDKMGVIVKADSLGSLEALINLLRENGIKIKKASIGEITKKEIAEAIAESDPFNKVILGFNIKHINVADVKIMTSDIVYKIIDGYKEWREKKEKELKLKELHGLIRPCALKILPNCVFRQSHPAIVGVEILSGILKTGTPLMKETKELSYVKEIQQEGKTINESYKGKQVAISLPGLTVGRQINENELLYSNIPEKDFKKLKELKSFLNSDEIGLLKEIANKKRKENPLWGV